MEKKMTYEEFVKKVAKMSKVPPTYGLHLATSGKKPMPKELAKLLKECYEKNLTPEQTILELA